MAKFQFSILRKLTDSGGAAQLLSLGGIQSV